VKLNKWIETDFPTSQTKQCFFLCIYELMMNLFDGSIFFGKF